MTPEDILASLAAVATRVTGSSCDDDLRQQLQLIAEDLATQDRLMRAASSDAEKRKHREAAARIVDHAASMALSKANVANNEARELFLKFAREALPKLLPLLITVL
jgi:hypothetical protein